MNEILLIGVGNEYRSDDALGILVARELQRRLLGRIRIIEESGEGASLMEAWLGAAGVLLVDALESSEPPGSVHRIDVSRHTLPHDLVHYSSHAFGLVEAVELARHLQQLPPTAILYGIVGESFEPGRGLSDRVVRSIPDLLHLVEEDLHQLSRN